VATTYKFTISMPVTDVAPRNRITNTVHLQHSIGGLLDTDLQAICADLVAMYQTRYGASNREIVCKAYDTDAVPNYPRAEASVNAGSVWVCTHPREVALVLSFAGSNRGNKSERGRIYLMPAIAAGIGGTVDLERPSNAAMTWAMNFYTEANASFPDIGGVDWQFGVYSPTYKKFTQSKQAWCNDEWDTQRRRGLRETTRLSVNREG
jgi:hypothetical protein